MSGSRMVAAGLAVLLAVGGLAGCSDDVDPATETVQMFCASADEASMSVAEFQQMLTGDATSEEIQTQSDAVKTAIADTADQAQGLAESVDTELQNASQDFEDALAAIGDSAVGVEEAKAQAETAADAYLTTVSQLKSELGCGA